MGQKSPSPSPKSDGKFNFASILRSSKSHAPHSPMDFNSPPMMAAGLRQLGGTLEGEGLGTPPRGRVKSMISAFEGERSRSNTLPSVLYSSTHVMEGPTEHAQSQGGTPTHSTSSSAVLNGQRSNSLDQSDPPNTTHASEKSNGGYESSLSSGIPKAGHVTGKSYSLKPEVRKLSTTFEVSIEESNSYVKLHPATMENGMSAFSERLEEEEGEREAGEGGGEERVRSQTEEVFVSMVQSGSVHVSSSEDNEGEGGEGGGGGGGLGTKGADQLNISTNSLLEDTSDELDISGGGGGGEGGQNSSLVNLYQLEDGEGGGGEERDSPQSGSEKHKKKKKWHLFKKRKSKEEQQMLKNRRSQSTDIPAEATTTSPVGVASRREKVRSISNDTYLLRGVGGGGGRRKVDRYTIYMQDYSMKLEERRRLSPKREADGEGEGEGEGGRDRRSTSGSGLDEADRGLTGDGQDRLADATPPAEMTPATFKQSLFCNQLKYKLRSALQNMHTPLTLTLQQLQLDGSGQQLGIRYQLILLIQHALQRTQWRQDDIETALLTEILRMVEPLPNEL